MINFVLSYILHYLSLFFSSFLTFCPSHSDYQWEAWGKWSECNRRCGNGRQRAERACAKVSRDEDEDIARFEIHKRWIDFNRWFEKAKEKVKNIGKKVKDKLKSVAAHIKKKVNVNFLISNSENLVVHGGAD